MRAALSGTNDKPNLIGHKLILTIMQVSAYFYINPLIYSYEYGKMYLKNLASEVPT